MDYTQKSASRYILTTLAVLLVLTALSLVALNAWQGKGMLGVSGKGYKEGFLAARKVYSNLCPVIGATNRVTGIVQSNNGTELGILQTSLDTDPEVDGVSNNRIITTTSDTAVQKATVKSPEEILAGLKNSTTTKTPDPSVGVSVTKLQLKDIQVGQVIVVSSNQDVRLLSTIPATSINVLK